MLEINTGLIWIMLNLLVFCFLLKKFLFGPINNVIEKRRELVESGMKEAEDKKSEAEALKAKYEEALEGSKAESESILADAKQSAKKEFDRILADAGHKSDKMLEAARQTIEMERAQTLNDLKSEIAAVAMSATENVLGKNTGAVNNQDLYDQFLKEVGEADEESDHK